jgi:hypothetical protein
MDMSRGRKANESPNHFMVLDAIGRGINTTDKISRVTRLDKTEVELIQRSCCPGQKFSFNWTSGH